MELGQVGGMQAPLDWVEAGQTNRFSNQMA